MPVHFHHTHITSTRILHRLSIASTDPRPISQIIRGWEIILCRRCVLPDVSAGQALPAREHVGSAAAGALRAVIDVVAEHAVWEQCIACLASIVILQQVAIRTVAALRSSEAGRTALIDLIAHLTHHRISTSYQKHLIVTGRTPVTRLAAIATDIALPARPVEVGVLPHQATTDQDGQQQHKSFSYDSTH